MKLRVACVALFCGLLVGPRDAPAPIRVKPEPSQGAADAPVRVGSVAIESLTVGPLTETGVASVAVHVRGLTPQGADIVDFGGFAVSLFQDDVAVPGDDLSVSRPEGDRPGFVLGFAAPGDGETHEIRVEIGGRSASATAVYPAPPLPSWVLPGAVAGGTGVVLALLLLLRLRSSAGSLSLLSGPGAGTSFRLGRGTTRIGAIPENDVVLESTQVSRHHAQITVRGRTAEIRDLHSTNGTRVNGHPVEQAFLTPGDKILIGDVELFYDR